MLPSSDLRGAHHSSDCRLYNFLRNSAFNGHSVTRFCGDNPLLLAGNSLLVTQHQTPHVSRVRGNFCRQAEPLQNADNTVDIRLRHPAHTEANLHRSVNTSGDRLAMEQLIPCCFHRMPNGVTEIQDRSKATFPLICLHDRCLDLDIASDDRTK